MYFLRETTLLLGLAHLIKKEMVLFWGRRGILILEELNHALNRNAYIYAEIAGYSSNSGVYHMVLPKEDGSDAAEAIVQT